MTRVKRGVIAKRRHKKILDLAKGYRGRRGNVYRVAKEAVMKAGQYAIGIGVKENGNLEICGLCVLMLHVAN